MNERERLNQEVDRLLNKRDQRINAYRKFGSRVRILLGPFALLLCSFAAGYFFGQANTLASIWCTALSVAFAVILVLGYFFDQMACTTK